MAAAAEAAEGSLGASLPDEGEGVPTSRRRRSRPAREPRPARESMDVRPQASECRRRHWKGLGRPPDPTRAAKAPPTGAARRRALPCGVSAAALALLLRSCSARQGPARASRRAHTRPQGSSDPWAPARACACLHVLRASSACWPRGRHAARAWPRGRVHGPTLACGGQAGRGPVTGHCAGPADQSVRGRRRSGAWARWGASSAAACWAPSPSRWRRCRLSCQAGPQPSVPSSSRSSWTRSWRAGPPAPGPTEQPQQAEQAEQLPPELSGWPPRRLQHARQPQQAQHAAELSGWPPRRAQQPAQPTGGAEQLAPELSGWPPRRAAQPAQPAQQPQPAQPAEQLPSELSGWPPPSGGVHTP